MVANLVRNNRLFSISLIKLLKILSSWEPRPGPNGLVLELSAVSPSDVQHRFRNFELEDEYPFQCEEDLRRNPSVLEYSRQKEMEVQTAPGDVVLRHRTVTPSATIGEYRRMQGTRLELRPWRKFDIRGRRNPIPTLPDAPLVKGLLIRRAFYRAFSPTTLAELFRQSLRSVEWFRLERWISITIEDEHAFIRGETY